MVRLHNPKPRHRKLKFEKNRINDGLSQNRSAAAKFLIHSSYFLIFILIFSSCGSKSHKQFDPQKVNFSASLSPLYAGQLYPSLLLALNQADTSLSVSLTAPANNAVLRIVVDSSAFNYVTILQEILPSRGQTYTFHPSIKWKYDQLRLVRQHRPLDLTFSCYINDEEVDIENLHLDIRSVNECPLSLRSPDGTVVDTRFLFAAYVNEEHPAIQQILSDILDQGIVRKLQGYQSSRPSDVTDQAFAVWYYALNRGISYSSISCTPNPNPRANVQHIRFFDEVHNTRQANCIDACVFLASILRKIGLRPVIFVEPCHAYLGYYTDRKNKNIALLETTITSWVNFPQLRRSLLPDGQLPEKELDKISKYITPNQLDDYRNRRISTDQVLLLVARSLFDKASEYDRETYEANRDHFADPSNISYQQLDIQTLRQQIQPITGE